MVKRAVECYEMEVSEIYFKRQLEYDKCVHFYAVLFNIFLENIIQKTGTSASIENDCFADIAAEDGEEIYTLLSSVSVRR